MNLKAPHSRSIPLSLSTYVLDIIKLVPHLHHTVSNHPRVQPQSPSHRMLCFCARIESHDEIMALGVGGSLFSEGLGKQECAPIGDTTYNTTRAEDKGTSCLGNSGICTVRAERVYDCARITL